MGNKRRKKRAKQASRLALAGLGLLLAGTVLASAPARPPGRSPEMNDTRAAASERHRQHGNKQS
ncbi:MAG: hypothetical protein ACRETN_08150 [Nevskiales bacterium]